MKKIRYEYHHWGVIKKNKHSINKEDKSPDTLRLKSKRQEIAKPEKFPFELDGNLNRKVWVSRGPDQSGGVELEANDLVILFRQNKKNRWDVSHSEFNEPSTIWVAERNKQEPRERVELHIKRRGEAIGKPQHC